MEASGNPPPAGDPAPQAAPPPPPPPPTTTADDGKASGGWRVLAVVLFLALAFACAVMIIAMADIADTPVGQAACAAEPGCTEYFDGSSAQKTISLVLGFPSGVLAGIAALVALYFAATGLRGRLLLQLTGAAIALGALSLLIGSV
jgi:hypothetical protein